MRKNRSKKLEEQVAQQEKYLDKLKDWMVSLSTSVKRLEAEEDYILHQLKNQKSCREMDVPERDHRSIKHFHKQLEKKFNKTVDQIAELSDKKQQLEHLVTQLQGETDTIADYVALYEVQQGIMKTKGA
ncbi:golgin subfamily A member 2-like isoform X2 [Tachypleus tridentatus]|uniref:golgin subfamily A member 2-like isoform X2 n=1 Tax=Tachypleus tridentatus TaxID=6853 RepID=UPI003FD27CEB